MKAILRLRIAEKKLYDPACDDRLIGLTKKQRSVPESIHNDTAEIKTLNRN